MAFNSLQVGIETAVLFLGSAAGKAVPDTESAKTVINATELMSKSVKCAGAITGFIDSSLQSSEPNVGSLLVDCLAQATEAVPMLGLLLATSTAGGLIAFFAGSFTAVHDLITGRDKVTISITRKGADISGSTWEGPDDYFQMLRIDFGSDRTAQVYTLQAGYVQWSPLSCGTVCRFTWTTSGTNVIVKEENQTWTFQGPIEGGSLRGLGTYVRGAQHNFNLKAAPTVCPTSSAARSLLQKYGSVTRLQLACSGGYALADFDIATGSIASQTVIGILQEASNGWRELNRADVCPNQSSLPSWVRTACNVG
jgi:hypothetical protein